MRERAVELVTIELGPQSEHQVRRKLAGEVGADRWTRLDATLRREAQRTEYGLLDFRPEVARSGAIRDETRALLIGRLQKLERVGLARAIGQPDGCWQKKRSRVCASLASAATSSGRYSARFRHKGKNVPPAILRSSTPRLLRSKRSLAA